MLEASHNEYTFASTLSKANLIIVLSFLSKEVKVYMQRSGSRIFSKHRPFEYCHSRRQISENQVNRLRPSILRPLAGDHLNPSGNKARRSVSRMRPPLPLRCHYKASRGKGRERREVSISGTGKSLWLRAAQNGTKESCGRTPQPTI